MPRKELSCAEIEERLEVLLDAGRDVDEQTSRHLAECPDCSRALDLARRVRRELRALPKHDLPPTVIARIKSYPGTDAAPRSRGRRFGRRAWLAAAAAVALVATTLVWISNERESRPSAAEVARAELEMRYALAQVARLSRKAGDELREEVIAGRVAGSVRRGLSRSVSSMRSIRDGDGEEVQPNRPSTGSPNHGA